MAKPSICVQNPSPLCRLPVGQGSGVHAGDPVQSGPECPTLCPRSQEEPGTTDKALGGQVRSKEQETRTPNPKPSLSSPGRGHGRVGCPKQQAFTAVALSSARAQLEHTKSAQSLSHTLHPLLPLCFRQNSWGKGEAGGCRSQQLPGSLSGKSRGSSPFSGGGSSNTSWLPAPVPCRPPGGAGPLPVPVAVWTGCPGSGGRTGNPTPDSAFHPPPDPHLMPGVGWPEGVFPFGPTLEPSGGALLEPRTDHHTSTSPCAPPRSSGCPVH